VFVGEGKLPLNQNVGPALGAAKPGQAPMSVNLNLHELEVYVEETSPD
jgi:hypothetical protein